MKYALAHYKSLEQFEKDNDPKGKFLQDESYILKGDGSNKHSCGWFMKNGKGNIIEFGHTRREVDYIVSADNKDVTTFSNLKKAFQERS